MNILYISGTDPRIISNGNAQRTNLVWKTLKSIGDVYTICHYHGKGWLDEKNLIYACYMQQPEGIKGFINKSLNHLWRFFDFDGPKCLLFPWEFRGTPFLNTKFDIVVSRYIEPAAQAHLWKYAPLVVDIDDHPVFAFIQRDGKSISRIKYDIALMLRKYVWSRVRSKMVYGWLSNREELLTEKIKSKISVLSNIPHLPNSNYNKECIERDNYIFSVGYMVYSPNCDGVNDFLENIWPNIHRQFPDIRYYIVGKGAPKELADKWNRIEGVKYLGFVDNLSVLYEHALATVVPVTTGSGTCIKTLESLAFSRACLATKYGLRGLETNSNIESYGLLEYHDAESFTSLFMNFVLDENKRKSIEHNARLFIENEYTEKTFSDEIVNRIQEIISK